MGGTVAESMCRVGGRVLKMKLMLSQPSTKLELKLKLKLSLAKIMMPYDWEGGGSRLANIV